jgi:hypothetical protein
VAVLVFNDENRWSFAHDLLQQRGKTFTEYVPETKVILVQHLQNKVK